MVGGCIDGGWMAGRMVGGCMDVVWLYSIIGNIVWTKKIL